MSLWDDLMSNRQTASPSTILEHKMPAAGSTGALTPVDEDSAEARDVVLPLAKMDYAATVRVGVDSDNGTVTTSRSTTSSAGSTSKRGWLSMRKRRHSDPKIVSAKCPKDLALHAALNQPTQLKHMLSFSMSQVNAPDADEDGRTPLHWAAARGNRKCVKALLAAGADASVRDSTGKTPAELARALDQEEVAVFIDAHSVVHNDKLNATPPEAGDGLVVTTANLAVAPPQTADLLCC